MRTCPVCRREQRRLRNRDARAAAAHPHVQHDRLLARRHLWRKVLRYGPAVLTAVLLRILAGSAIGGLIGLAAALMARAAGVHS